MSVTNILKPVFSLALLLLASSIPLIAQHSSSIVYDSIFTDRASAQSQEMHRSVHAWGMNVLMSTNGFGLGTFYRHAYSDDLAGFLDLSISEAKDDKEVDYVDPYTGQSFTPGKLNHFLLFPLMAGLEKRLFKDDILDNFRPYVEAAAGPTMIYVFPYTEDYFSALGKGHPKYTVATFVGIGAYFGSEQSNVMGLNLRYYFIPYPGGIESFDTGTASAPNITKKTQFGGFYITLNFGNAW